MATFWERAAYLVNHVFSLYCVYLLYRFCSHFGFESGTVDLIVPVPDHCLPFPICDKNS